MQKVKSTTNINFYGKESPVAAPGLLTAVGQQQMAQELRQSKNQLNSLYKSLPRDSDKLFLNPDPDYMNQQFVSEYQKQQKNIKNIYGGTPTVSSSHQLLKVPKLKLKAENSVQGENAAQAASVGLPASAKAIRKQTIRLPGGAKPSQINSGRLAKNSQIHSYKLAAPSGNEPPKRSSSNKLVKQQGIMHSQGVAMPAAARKPQKTHKASSKQRQLVGPNSQNLHHDKSANLLGQQRQFVSSLGLQPAHVPQAAQSSRQESADILYFQKNQMSAATALSSFNQAESQHAAANPMNSYAQSPFQADIRRGTHQQPMYQTLQEPLRSQQQRHSAEPKLKNNKVVEYNLNQNQLGQEQPESHQMFSKRALTGRTQDDEVVYVPHQKSSYMRDSELQTDAKSSNSLSRLSRQNQPQQPQMNNFVYDEPATGIDGSGADFNPNKADFKQNLDDDVAQFGKFSQDLQKLQTSNMSMRELLQKAGVAVASLAKTSYLFKKQNKINLELQEAKEQDCRPDAQSTNSKSTNSFLHLNQMIKLISLDINRINNSFNEVHFKMLENDDHLQGLMASFQSLQSNSKTLSHILQLQNNQYKQQKEQKHIQNQLCTLLLENQRLKQQAKQEELQGQDRDTCQNLKIESLDEQLRDSRRDNMILIQKVEQASKKLQSKEQLIKQLQQKNNALAKLLQTKQDDSQHRKPRSGSQSQPSARELSKDGENPQATLYRNQIQKLVSQVQVFIEAMKNLQKLIGSKVTDASGNVVPPDKAQVKLCKEKFEVSQKIMEQTIKQIKKENVDVFKNDQAASNMLNEEYTKRLAKEKERANLQKKQITELEANLQLEREKLQTYLQQNQVLTIKIEDLEQQMKARQSIQRATQHTQTLKKLVKDQQTQASKLEPRLFARETQTEQPARRPFSMSSRTLQESILPVVPTQVEILKNENQALVSQVERQECSLKILKEQIQALSQTANEQCRDCLYYESQLKALREKDTETKYLKLLDETAELKAKLNQLEELELPTIRSEKQKLLKRIEELTQANDDLKKTLEDKNQKGDELSQIIKESQSKQSEICRNLDESSLKNEQLTQRLNESQQQLSKYRQEKQANDEKVARQIDALQERINDLVQEKAQQEQTEKEMQLEVDRLSKEKEDLTKDKADCQHAFDVEKQHLTQQLEQLRQTLDNLLQEKEANDLILANQKRLEDLDAQLKAKQAEAEVAQEKIREMQRTHQEEMRETREKDNGIKEKELQEKEQIIEKKDDEIKQRDEAIKQKDDLIKEKEEMVAAKDSEIKVLSEKMKANEEAIKAKQDLMEAKDKQLAEVQGNLGQLQQEMQESESIRSKHYEALESNRDTMAMLKEQISKGLQKQKQQNAQINAMTSQITKLKTESQGKDDEHQKKLEEERQASKKELDEQKAKVKELEVENQDKEQLVCEANRVIEEFGDTQHDIKAKFKHLIQVYIQNITQSELQSSYKGDDSSLSIDGCFEQIQDALENQAEKSVLSYRNRPDAAVVPQVAQPRTAQLDPQALQLLLDSQQRVDFAHQMILENNNEVQRIVKQLQNAQKKIAKYKACVTDLKSKLQRTAKALGDKNVQLAERQRRIESLTNQLEVLKEEKNEKDGQLERGNSEDKETQTQAAERVEKETQVDETKEEIAKLKKEIEELKKGAKKKAANSSEETDKSEQIEQLEEENMELLAKLQKTEKELQEARQKSESLTQNRKNKADKEDDDLLTNIELSEEAKKQLDGITEQIKELNRRLAVAMIELADQQTKKDVESSSKMLINSESPNKKDQHDESMNLESTIFQQRRDHVTQIRTELKEAYEEMMECRMKLEKNANLLDDKDLQTLKDDVQFFTAENHELTVKAKALVLKNNEQALQIKELQHNQKQVLKKSMINLDMSSIILDAMEQQTRKSDQLDFFYTAYSGPQSSAPDVQECENSPDKNLLAVAAQAEDASALKRRPASSTSSQNEKQVNNTAVITSVVTLDANRDGSDKNAVNSEESAETSSGDQQLRLSRIERMIDEQQKCIGEGDQVQSSISMLRQIHTELKAHVLALMKQKKTEEEAGGAKDATRQDDESNAKKSALIEPDNSFDSAKSSGSDYRGILEHVKSTLALYLRKVPIIEASNETMLKIMFSMLKFTPEEISDLEAARKQLPIYVIDKKQSKKLQKEQEANLRKSSQLASSQNSGSRERSESVSNAMPGKPQGLKKPNTPSDTKNKLIDMMKSSFSGKLQSSSAHSSGSKQKESAVPR